MRNVIVVGVVLCAFVAEAEAKKAPAIVAATKKLIDKQVASIDENSDAESVAPLYTASAVIIQGEQDDAQVPVGELAQYLFQGYVMKKKLTDLKITPSADGTVAWVSFALMIHYDLGNGAGEEKLNYRASELVVMDGDEVRIAGGMWSKPMADKQAHKLAKEGQLSHRELGSGDAELAAAVKTMLTEDDPTDVFSERTDMLVIGSAAGEKTAGGMKFLKNWLTGWAGKVEVESVRAMALPGGKVAWAVANLNLPKPGKKGQYADYVIPFRVMFVLADDGTGWRIVHAHFSVVP